MSITARQRKAAEAAKLLYARADIDFDDNMRAEDFSETGDAENGGMWVRAWVYVEASEL